MQILRQHGLVVLGMTLGNIIAHRASEGSDGAVTAAVSEYGTCRFIREEDASADVVSRCISKLSPGLGAATLGMAPLQSLQLG